MASQHLSPTKKTGNHDTSSHHGVDMMECAMHFNTICQKETSTTHVVYTYTVISGIQHLLYKGSMIHSRFSTRHSIMSQCMQYSVRILIVILFQFVQCSSTFNPHQTDMYICTNLTYLGTISGVIYTLCVYRSLYIRHTHIYICIHIIIHVYTYIYIYIQCSSFLAGVNLHAWMCISLGKWLIFHISYTYIHTCMQMYICFMYIYIYAYVMFIYTMAKKNMIQSLYIVHVTL